MSALDLLDRAPVSAPVSAPVDAPPGASIARRLLPDPAAARVAGELVAPHPGQRAGRFAGSAAQPAWWSDSLLARALRRHAPIEDALVDAALAQPGMLADASVAHEGVRLIALRLRQQLSETRQELLRQTPLALRSLLETA